MHFSRCRSSHHSYGTTRGAEQMASYSYQEKSYIRYQRKLLLDFIQHCFWPWLGRGLAVAWPWLESQKMEIFHNFGSGYHDWRGRAGIRQRAGSIRRAGPLVGPVRRRCPWHFQRQPSRWLQRKLCRFVFHLNWVKFSDFFQPVAWICVQLKAFYFFPYFVTLIGCIGAVKIGNNVHDILKNASDKSGVEDCNTCAQQNPCQSDGICQVKS